MSTGKTQFGPPLVECIEVHITVRDVSWICSGGELVSKTLVEEFLFGSFTDAQAASDLVRVLAGRSNVVSVRLVKKLKNA